MDYKLSELLCDSKKPHPPTTSTTPKFLPQQNHAHCQTKIWFEYAKKRFCCFVGVRMCRNLSVDIWSGKNMKPAWDRKFIALFRSSPFEWWGWYESGLDPARAEINPDFNRRCFVFCVVWRCEDKMSIPITIRDDRDGTVGYFFSVLLDIKEPLVSSHWLL